MKKITVNTAKSLLLGLFSVALVGCSSDDSTDNPNPGGGDGGPVSNASKLDLNQFRQQGVGVMMQAFYWNVEPKGGWYDLINSKIDDWSATGVNRIWLPAPGKGQSGFSSMGYDPSDYFDVGEFDQHNTIETRFGSRTELENLIAKAHSSNVQVVADIVMGHNSGGGKQENPFRPGDTEVYTLFNKENGNASDKFNRDYNHFHPNDIHSSDGFEDNLFFAKTDVCLEQKYVQDWLWGRDDSVAEFYKNTLGFDGWRFDYVKSFDPKWVKAWNDKVGGFSVGENFDGNAQVLKDWVDASGSPAFDFACFYKLDETLDRNKDLTALGGANNMLRKIYPDKAVTFTANHDTEKDTNTDNNISFGNKMIAYAYILTHDGYPTLFYNDYENTNFKDNLKNLVLIHNSIAIGNVEILKANKDEYIMKRSGEGDNPGLIFYINISNQTKQSSVRSNWPEKKLVDYADNSTKTLTADANGQVTIETPAKSFTIWSIGKE